jgi:GAF domain-containing protein
MASTTKKGSRKTKAKPRGAVTKKSQPKQAQNIQALQRALDESLAREAATSDILRMIASSPTDLQTVLDAIAERAAKLCDAEDAAIFRVDANLFRLAAHFGPIPMVTARGGGRVIDRGTTPGRAIVDRQTIHVHDLPAAEAEFPGAKATGIAMGVRTVLDTPLLREGIAIGAIHIRRREVRPFSDRQIKLLETFADQAVIAIENARLIHEQQARNRDLAEALEQQTATSEILRVIASSPTEIQPVLEAVAESATRLCEAHDAHIGRVDGNILRLNAHSSDPSRRRDVPITRGHIAGQAILDRRTVHIHDLAAQPEDNVRAPGWISLGVRTVLATPLLREGAAIGTIIIRRMEIRPFTEKQIALLETFANQAVIAIENVRLFNELEVRNRDLTEALEQQTATSEILRAIANSPTEIQPVLDVIAENAARICGTPDVAISRVENDVYRFVATYGSAPNRPAGTTRPIDRGSVIGRSIVDRQTIHIHDVRTVEDDFWRVKTGAVIEGLRTMLATPLLREGVAIGAIGIRRTEVHPFTDKQIALLKTFADQAVIAIENVRLFQELKEALEQQTATSEILGVIASSPTDVQPVLNTVAANAARLCEATDAQIRLVEADQSRLVASFGNIPAPEFRPMIPGTVSGRAIFNRETVHVHDLQDVTKREFPESVGARFGVRTMLCTPMLREGIPIGVITVRRTEVRPFSDKQIKLLETFADQAVIAIENVRLFKELDERTNELTRSVDELKALGEVGQAVSSTLDLETVLTSIVSHAVQLSGTDGGAIYEYDEHSEEFLLRATDHMEEELINALRANPPRLGDGVVGRAAASREPVQVPNILEERGYAPRMREMLERFGFRASLAVPLLREDRIIGGLVVRRKSTGEFRPEVIELLKTFATQSVLAIQNARLFREIEDKSRQIEAANRHKSEFLANMSHELRTPLNAIIGFSEVLGERLFGELNEKQAEYTDDILSSGRHLLSLINEILDLSKVEAGRMELELATFDLPSAIDNARTFVRERATRHGITLDVTIDERLGDFVGDERKIKQILLNLLSTP